MTVKDLIKLLEKQDPKASLVVREFGKIDGTISYPITVKEFEFHGSMVEFVVVTP